MRNFYHYVYAMLLISSTALLFGCSNLLVGKHASGTGSPQIAYTSDAGFQYGGMGLYPAANHTPGTRRQIYDEDSGAYAGEIPEAAHTYNAVAYHGGMNEHQLAISETTFGTRHLRGRQRILRGVPRHHAEHVRAPRLVRVLELRELVVQHGRLLLRRGLHLQQLALQNHQRVGRLVQGPRAPRGGPHGSEEEQQKQRQRIQPRQTTTHGSRQTGACAHYTLGGQNARRMEVARSNTAVCVTVCEEEPPRLPRVTASSPPQCAPAEMNQPHAHEVRVTSGGKVQAYVGFVVRALSVCSLCRWRCWCVHAHCC